MADIDYAVQLIDDTLDAIIPRCFQCREQLRPDGPSLDFCGYNCQLVWHQRRAADPMPSGGLRLHAHEHVQVAPQPDPPGPLETLWLLLTRPRRKR